MILAGMRLEYFDWLKRRIDDRCFPVTVSYNRLIARLHEKEFRYILSRDSNRANDGTVMRYRFALHKGYEDNPDEIIDILDGPCSILEMMVALAIRCEDTIMDDPDIGDRAGTWFWNMVVNLGLGDMTDDRFDDEYFDYVIERFLYRAYEPNGRGGLFTVRNPYSDLRDVEIWIQMLWYLDSITGTDV